MTESSDIQDSDRRDRPGVLPSRLVRGVTFLILSLSILAACVVSILSVWGMTQDEVVWRTIATLAIMSGAAVMFVVVNERFAI